MRSPPSVVPGSTSTNEAPTWSILWRPLELTHGHMSMPWVGRLRLSRRGKSQIFLAAIGEIMAGMLWVGFCLRFWVETIVFGKKHSILYICIISSIKKILHYFLQWKVAERREACHKFHGKLCTKTLSNLNCFAWKFLHWLTLIGATQ